MTLACIKTSDWQTIICKSMFTGKQVNFDSKMPYFSIGFKTCKVIRRFFSPLLTNWSKGNRQNFCHLASHTKNLQIIRACLNRENSKQSSHSKDERLRANSVFSEFKVVTGDQLMKLIGKISKNSCDLDPITVLRYPQDAFKDLFYHWLPELLIHLWVAR